MILDPPLSPFLPSPNYSSAVVSPSAASSVPDFLDDSPDAVVAVIVSFLDHRTRLNLPSRLTTDPMATRAINSDVDREFLNFVFCEASEAEFQRFLVSARPVHVNLTLAHFDDPEMANDRLAEVLGRAKLGLRSLCLSGSWKSHVLQTLKEKISACRKFLLRDVLIDTEFSLFPVSMPFTRQFVLDNVVYICDRNFIDNFPFPLLPRLETLHLAVRPVVFTLEALEKYRSQSLTVKYVAKKEDVLKVSDILSNKFPTLKSLEIDSLPLCDWVGKFSHLQTLTVGSAAILDDRIFKIEKFPTQALKETKLRLQAPSPEMVRKFFRCFIPGEALEKVSVAWNSEEDFLDDLIALRVILRNFRFSVVSNGMGIEAERKKNPVREFHEEFGALIKCRCLQCRLEELAEHSRLIAETVELSEEATAFYQLHSSLA